MIENRLKHLYVEELKDLFSAENQLLKALPKMAKASTSEDLRAGFEEHLEQTKEHVARLEKIFKALSETAGGKKCKGMAGLIDEGAEMIAEDPDPEELDACARQFDVAAYSGWLYSCGRFLPDRS
jgi:ferritin-like metal-binding protein YciE